jgi:hypothetical protein
MALAAALGNVSPLTAQGRKAGPAVPRRAPPQPRRPQGNPARELDRFSRMSPKERQEQLAKLPPARRQQIEQRLERYQKLPPQQREQLRKRYEAFQNLPDDRQDAVREELQNLRGLPPAQRKSRLDSPEVRQSFSQEEQQLLRESMGQPDML